MGELFRRFWVPALLSQELAEPDCPPVRVKIMGEDLIAFRDSKNRIGLIEPHCAHRGANLFFGRNEQEGIRCAYHGWYYDRCGKVIDRPAEPIKTAANIQIVEVWQKVACLNQSLKAFEETPDLERVCACVHMQSGDAQL